MRKKNTSLKRKIFFGLIFTSSTFSLLNPSQTEIVEAAKSAATHIGTFEGSTTFTTSSSNGINPGLFIEVMDEDGNLTQYESEEGVITIPNTKEGAYVTQAKFLGKTKYWDEDTGETLENWEEGRNLSLMSVENPVLQTVGKNLFDVKIEHTDGFYRLNSGIFTNSSANSYIVSVQPNTNYKMSVQNLNRPNESVSAWHNVSFWDKDKNYISGVNSFPDYYTTPNNCYFIRFAVSHNIFDIAEFESKFQIEEGIEATPYIPYQSNTLMINEAITLRGIGDVRDELDLITGEFVQCVGEWHITATEDSWRANQDFTPADGYSGFNFTISTVFSESLIPKYFPKRMATLGFATHAGHTSANRGTDFHNNGNGKLVIESSLVAPRDLEGLKQWLEENKVMLQYELATPVVKTVALISDYFFKPINKESIEVDGTVIPLVASISVPTEPLFFILDPNQEEGQQFIAPDFTLINETLAPLQIELKHFVQTTNVLNDVLPDAHENWNELNKTESQDIAVALVPIPSSGWLSLAEGPRYAVNTSNSLLGTTKGQSAVDFSFDALHGRAFSEVLNPQYRLAFVFGFSQ